MSWDYAPIEDCIHLKACRRVQAIGKSLRLNVPRYCSEECTALERAEAVRACDIDSAIEYARNESGMIREGYDEYDAFLESELDSKSGETLYRLIKGEKNVEVNT